MAETRLDSSWADFVKTLDLSSVPERLHCPICHNFLLDPLKAPCCDTSICESCVKSAVNACPQCSHSPFAEDMCNPALSSRKTAKAWLKDARARAAGSQNNKPVEVTEAPQDMSALLLEYAGVPHDQHDGANDDNQTIVQSVEVDTQPMEAQEEENQADFDPHSDPADGGDDEVVIQVEDDHEDISHQDRQISDEEQENGHSQYASASAQDQQESRPSSRGRQEFPSKSGGFNMANPMGGYSGSMTPDSIMQQMQAMQQQFGAGNMNFPMGAMNPMMFGGMNGMNGMNMGMNFNPPQNMFGSFQNNNMWQNSNANAFSNGMGTDFNYGFNSHQQQQFPNGDLQQNGYRGGRGRGRGRGRGGFGRGRGNFNQFDNHRNNFQAMQEQQQYEMQNMQNMQNMQSQMMMNNRPDRSREQDIDAFKQVELTPDDDEFAPGGQDEVQEALGDDYAKKEPEIEAKEVLEDEPTAQHVSVKVEEPEPKPDIPSDNPPPQNDSGYASEQVKVEPESKLPIPEAYAEDLDMAMPPPSAPSGPSGRYAEKDFGFRSRGHGRFSQSRGSIYLSNGHPPSPVRSTSAQNIARPDSAGVGVAGAPTGPRAMMRERERDREPAKPAPPTRLPSNGGGFQIMGRASMASKAPGSGSVTPNGHSDHQQDDRQLAREVSQRDEDYDDHDHSRRHRKSRHDDEDFEMEDASYSGSRAHSPDRKSSHRSRREKEKYPSNGSSRPSRRHGDDQDQEKNDYGDPAPDSESRSRSHRKHRERERDREREPHKERDRSEKYPDADRHRKRSRRDRDDDDEAEEEYDSSRHKSRRHRREHTSTKETTPVNNGLDRTSSHRSQPTTTSTPVKAEAPQSKDPYTAERERNQRERMVAEQNKNKKPAKGGAWSGGNSRRSSVRYEDDVERGMVENERNNRWR